MSTVPRPTRHPLALPAGSVRTIIALMITGLFWLVVALPPERNVVIPLNHYFLMALVMLLFVSHKPSHDADEVLAPFGLPIGLFRIAILLGTVALFAWLWHREGEQLLERMTPRKEQLEHWTGFMFSLAGGFGLGYLVRLGPWRNSAVFQDIQAWVSILAMIGLGVEFIIRVFINPNVSQERGFDTFPWECALTGTIAFYFGSRG
jgi:hypothetical protein